MDRREAIKSMVVGTATSLVPTKTKTKELQKCEHLRVFVPGAYLIGKVYCPDCDKDMHITEALNSHFRAMEKRIKLMDSILK